MLYHLTLCYKNNAKFPEKLKGTTLAQNKGASIILNYLNVEILKYSSM